MIDQSQSSLSHLFTEYLSQLKHRLDLEHVILLWSELSQRQDPHTPVITPHYVAQVTGVTGGKHLTNQKTDQQYYQPIRLSITLITLSLLHRFFICSSVQLLLTITVSAAPPHLLYNQANI